MARILIIEDDTATREWLESLFSRNGYVVDSATNGKEGVDLFRINPADLVVTDIVMPEKDGIETIADLRRAYPGVRIIAISGGERRPEDISRNYLHSAKLVGADRALQKPVTNDELLSVVKELLS